MANYILTTFTTTSTSISTVLAAMEAKLETVDTGKSIRLIDIDADTSGNERTYTGYIIYDT